MPGVSGVLVVTTLCLLHCTGAAGARAPGIPHALYRAKVHAHLGRVASRERGVAFAAIARSEATKQSTLFLSLRDGLLCFARNDGIIAITCVTPQPSSPAKAGDPVFQSRRSEIGRPRRTGCPAFAGHDSSPITSRKRFAARAAREGADRHKPRSPADPRTAARAPSAILRTARNRRCSRRPQSRPRRDGCAG